MKYTREQIQITVEDKGYKYFHDNLDKGYDVNIIGVRNSKTKGRVTNAFDDTLTISYNRDDNRDKKYDLNESKTETGIFGINIHRATGRAGGKSTRVDKWSAGCQVIADNDDWHAFLDICQTSREIHGNSFSYTLIESKDLG